MSERRTSRLPDAMPISRALRLLTGAAALATVAGPVWSASWNGRLRVAAVVLGLIVLYTAVHYVVGRYLGGIHPCAGACVALVPVVVLFLQGGAFGLGVVAFIGLSLVLIAVLGHPGCEVLAFPTLLLGRRTHLACIFFSPLDWLEARIFGYRGRH